MPRYCLELAYDGSHFCGWQVQPTHQRGDAQASIQETVEAAVSQMTGERPTVVASGRTDAGVHALGQVTHVDLKTRRYTPERLFVSLNALLPQAIRVLKVHSVGPEFHSRFCAIKKEYAYYIGFGTPLPHLARYVWFLPEQLDLAVMSRALKQLQGKHDFGVFQGKRAEPGPTERTIYRASVKKVRAGPCGVSGQAFVRVSLIGSGFLKQMARSIVGTVIEIGLGRLDPDHIQELLRSQDRSKVGRTAPGAGLWLEKVWYPRRFNLNS